MLERRVIEIEGTVQGVGFRPYVHRLAAAEDLRGFVRNDASRVVIDVEGESDDINAFCLALTAAPPPLSAIRSMHIAEAPLVAHGMFRIAPSVTGDHGTSGWVATDAVTNGHRSPNTVESMRDVAPPIPPDVATCERCLAELFDPTNRRFQHAFISCTDCGPRFTIVHTAPYDRERTTMAPFPLCDSCEREYHDPLDRRFHTEAIACSDCGPMLRLRPETAAVPMDAAITVLRGGGIVALKALGGFHLACDATDFRAVERLRQRKHRPTKPFAVMVRNVEAAREFCDITDREQAALVSPARPVVLLARRASMSALLVPAPNAAPGNANIGVMLPSTPLHHLLLAAVPGPLIMTSGNRSGEPVAIDDHEAWEALGDIADAILTHDRAIAARCDDSVVHAVADAVRQVRRSRGRVPQAMTMPVAAREPILAVGGHLKNTVCVARGRNAFLSAHVGDLDSVAGRGALMSAIATTAALADVKPLVVAHDLHPEYASTRIAEWYRQEHGAARLVAVQHHHAHVAACVAEYGVREPVIGVVFDGAGLGADGAIWGGEFLVVTGAQYVRAGHLGYVPLPGGDAASRTPWRSAVAHLTMADIDGERIEQCRPEAVSYTDWALVRQLATRSALTHRTSSVGRLFDAVASLTGIAHTVHFEGEAAMALESAATESGVRGYGITLGSGTPWTVDPALITREVLADLQRGRDRNTIASAFHATLRDMVVLGSERIREDTGLSTVVLTGGVFMNKRLTESAVTALRARRFQVLVPQHVPCNDGGLAFGQAHVAACALEDELCA